jgi:hypothetical protein
LDNQEDRHPGNATQEQRVRKGLDVVLSAGEAGAADQPLPVKREIPCVDQWHDDHGDEDDEERQNQRVGRTVLSTLGLP